MGGEEFAILAPDTDEHGAYILAERLRTVIAREFAGNQPDPLTISFGIVSYPVHGQTGLVAAPGRRPGPVRRQAPGPQPLGDLQRRGAGHPQRHRAARGREDASVELTSLLSLAEALDVRDSGSATHCRRVGRYSELIARELGLPPDSVERVRIAGVLHDVGRVGVPDELLAKEGPLDEEEWHWVRSHPEIGARMLETTDFADIGGWIRSHHERPDGSGYPEGRERRAAAGGRHPGRGRRVRGDDRRPALPRRPGSAGGVRRAAARLGAPVRRAGGRCPAPGSLTAGSNAGLAAGVTK